MHKMNTFMRVKEKRKKTSWLVNKYWYDETSIIF